jgi:hypothetical protein
VGLDPSSSLVADVHWAVLAEVGVDGDVHDLVVLEVVLLPLCFDI